LRLIFILFPRPGDDDTLDYLELGHNLLHSGVYGLGSAPDLSPSICRLPGYPLILAGFEWIFAPWWPDKWLNALFVTQAALDLSAGLLIALLAQRLMGKRAGQWALALAMPCPFTAVEAGIAMTESLSIFAVAVGLSAAMLALDAEHSRRNTWLLAVAGLAAGLATELRPDGVMLFAALAGGVFFYIWRQSGPRRALAATAMLLATTLLVILPWTVRNWRTFHVLQPLAPRYLNDPGQRAYSGVDHWMRTWSSEYVDTATVFWAVGEERINPANLPRGACDSQQECAATAALFKEYNRTMVMSGDLYDRFDALAEQRIRSHPVRYYVWLPLERDLDMLLRPRTITFGLDIFWWRYNNHPWQTLAAVGLGLVNLCYVGLAAWGFMRRRVPWALVPGGYLLLRLAVLGLTVNPEPRYTIECFPALFIAAAAAVARKE